MRNTLALLALVLMGCAKEVQGPAPIAAPIAAPMLIEPRDGEVIPRDGAFLVWAPVRGAVRYGVEITSQGTTEHLSAIQTRILWYGSGIVTWRVHSVRADGLISQWSETRTFVLP